MTSNRRSAILSAAAALALVLIVADFIVGQFNRSAQVQASQRQQFINQSLEVSRINQTLVRALAVAAATNHDPQIEAVLAAQGITVNVAAAVDKASPAGQANAAPPASGQQP